VVYSEGIGTTGDDGGAMAIKLVLVDYENIQNIEGIDTIQDAEFRVLVGKNQTKIPIDLVLQTQQLGKSLEWLKVSGQGKNALDFHIAFYLGKYVEANKYGHYVIVSKDTGYDALIEHINESKGSKIVKRVTNITQVSNKQVDKTITPEMRKLIEQLKKIQGNKRPKKRSTLIGFATSVFVNQKSKEEVSLIVEDLYSRKYISEANGIIKYEIDNVSLK